MRGRLRCGALAALVVVAAGSTPAVAWAPDTSPPVVDAVVSTDFPPPGGPTPPPGGVGRPGSFTITAHDDGGGLRRIEWLLDSPFGVGGVTPDTRFGGSRSLDLAPSAVVTVQVTPPSWGSHTLQVRAVDRGGRVTQTFGYPFVVAGTAALPRAGDVTGDGLPDVVTTGVEGDLRVYPGTPSGALGAPLVASAGADAPGGRGWADTIVGHGPGNDAADDLWVLDPTRTFLTTYRNDGIGDFTSDASAHVTRPACAVGCPGDDPTWASVTSFVVSTDASVGGPTVVLTLEHGRLWRFPAFGGRLLSASLVPVAIDDPEHSDLVAPGDVTGDGLADLWVRDRVTGRLTQHVGTGTGFDPRPTVIAWSGFDATTHPVVTSVGDLSGDGVADLLTTSVTGGLQSRSATSVRSASWVSPAPFVARAVRVEGQAAHP